MKLNNGTLIGNVYII